tara:strand:- start:3339 stop:3956 length:618 start_codon:yes stop_codon:yes gene_type:complete
MIGLDWSMKQISSTVAGVITTATAKAHLRVDHSDEDDLIDRLVLSAISAIEARSGVAMIPQVVELRTRRFPNPLGHLALPYSPVRSITSVKYLDEDLAEQTVDTDVYAIDDAARPARVFLASQSEAWPTLCVSRPDAVRVRYEAGPSEAGNVHSDLISAALLLVGHLYEHRQSVAASSMAEVPMSVGALIAKHEIPNGELGVIDV